MFISGELIGGADITEELAESGELEEKLESALGADYRNVRGSKPPASGSAEAGAEAVATLTGRLDKVAALLEEAGARRRALARPLRKRT